MFKVAVRNIQRLFALILLSTLYLFIMLLNPGASKAEADREKATPKKVTIAYNVGNPPLKFKNQQGEATGILIDIWRLWGEKTGIEVEFKEALFTQTLEMIKKGDADIHAGLFYTKKRDKFLDYSAPIIDINYYSFYHESLPPVGSLKSLKPYRIGVPKGYTHSFIKNRLPDAAIKLYENFPALYDAATRGSILVFISPVMNLEYYMRQQGITNPFRYSPTKSIYVMTYLGAVRQGNRQLLRVVNQGLHQISSTERIAIERKWFRSARGSGDIETLIIACDSDQAPFTMLNAKGEPAGLFVDIWKKWAEKEKVTVQFIFDNRKGSIRSLKEGLADFHAGFQTEDKIFANSTPFYELLAKVFFHVDKNLHSMSDLTNRTVAVMDPSYGKFLKKTNSALEIEFTTDYSELFSKIGRGEITAFLDNELVVENLLLKQGRQGEFKTVSDFAHNVPISAIVPKDSRQLLKRINHGLQAISMEEYRQMENKWLNDPTVGYYHSREKRISLTERERQWLKKHPLIRIGVDRNYAPYAFVDQNREFSGIASDYIKILNKRLGGGMKVVSELGWEEVINRSKRQEIDILPCVGKTAEREKYLIFSRPYTKFQRVVIAPSDFPFISGLEELADYRIAVQANSSHEGYLKNNTTLPFRPFTTLQECLTAVSSGKADVFIGNLASATYWIRKLNLTNLKVAAPVGRDLENLYFAVRKDWPEMVSILNKGLESITPSEEDKIYQKWVAVKYETGIAKNVVIGYVVKIIAGAVTLLLVFFIWNYRLKREIVQRHKVEEQLKHYTSELEKANVHLQGLDRLKSMFIASMSHELRTPLNSIIGFTGVILQGMSGEINYRQKDQLSRVYRSAKHLLALISDVIDISKIEAGRIDIFPEPFRLSDIIDEAVENIQPQMKAKGLALELDVPQNLMMNTDRKRLLQCLINYFSNAVKFTEQGGITILVRKTGHTVEIKVKDTGIGIAEEDIPKLFDAFERLDTHLRVKAGALAWVYI